MLVDLLLLYHLLFRLLPTYLVQKILLVVFISLCNPLFLLLYFPLVFFQPLLLIFQFLYLFFQLFTSFGLLFLYLFVTGCVNLIHKPNSCFFFCPPNSLSLLLLFFIFLSNEFPLQLIQGIKLTPPILEIQQKLSCFFLLPLFLLLLQLVLHLFPLLHILKQFHILSQFFSFLSSSEILL